MLPSLLIAATLAAPGAPMPKDAVPNTTGPAPRIVAAKAEANGAVWITAQVYQKQKVTQQFFTVENGKQVMKQQEVEQIVPNYIRKTISDFGGKFNTADGTSISVEDATRRIKDGATLLVTADGKSVDAGWLKAVASDTVIMTAEGLGEAHFVTGYAPYPSTGSPRLVMLGIDDKGEVRVPVNANLPNRNGQVFGDLQVRGNFRGRIVIQNGADIVDVSGPQQTAPTVAGADGKKALADIKFDAYDKTGKLIPRSQALTRLKAGGMTLVAGDNRFPDADYLTAFHEDLIVIVSPELVFQPGQTNPFDGVTAKVAAPAAGAQPANPAPVQAVPAANIAGPAVIKQVQKQIQIQQIER